MTKHWFTQFSEIHTAGVMRLDEHYHAWAGNSVPDRYVAVYLLDCNKTIKIVRLSSYTKSTFNWIKTKPEFRAHSSLRPSMPPINADTWSGVRAGRLVDHKNVMYLQRIKRSQTGSVAPSLIGYFHQSTNHSGWCGERIYYTTVVSTCFNQS